MLFTETISVYSDGINLYGTYKYFCGEHEVFLMLKHLSLVGNFVLSWTNLWA